MEYPGATTGPNAAIIAGSLRSIVLTMLPYVRPGDAWPVEGQHDHACSAAGCTCMMLHHVIMNDFSCFELWAHAGPVQFWLWAHTGPVQFRATTPTKMVVLT